MKVSMILNDQNLFNEWKRDIETMAHRIIQMRKELYELLTNEFKTPAPGPNGWSQSVCSVGTWAHAILTSVIALRNRLACSPSPD